MNQKLKRLLILGCIGAIGYFLLSHHIILVGWDVRLLKKSRFTLEDTFFSTQGRTLESLLSNGQLRRDGIGKLLIEMGRMTKEELEQLVEKYRN
jgi:hypothetical protein